MTHEYMHVCELFGVINFEWSAGFMLIINYIPGHLVRLGLSVPGHDPDLSRLSTRNFVLAQCSVVWLYAILQDPQFYQLLC
jgi:hypothetical protein